MELNTDYPPNDVGVLAPNDQENEDANRRKDDTGAPKTPVARKSRRAVLKRMNATSEKDSPTHPDPPKTPGTPGHLHQATETPRRSCRKSVRPAIDYDDIIVRSAKKAIAEVLLADPEDEEPSVQKWTAAEVGRNSRKRGRKSKRMAAKKQKTELIISEDKEEQDTELEVPQKKLDTPQGVKETAEDQADIVEEVALSIKKSSSSKTADQEHAEDGKNIVEKPLSMKKYSKASKNRDQQRAANTKKQKEDEADIDELGLCPLDMDSQEESDAEAVQDEAQTSPVDEDGQKHKERDEQADEATKPAALDKDKEVAAAKDQLEKAVDDKLFVEEEMPSLLMESEGLDEPSHSPLNTTYDAEDKKDSDRSVILVVSPDKQPEASTSVLDASVILVATSDMEPVACAPNPAIPDKKPTIKVVLTTLDDQDETLLDLGDLATTNVSKSKGYRFPTPYKAKPMFKFTGTEETVSNDPKATEEEPKYKRKRSKSTTHWNDTMSRTVSFQSPVEVAIVEDIDKRWKELQKSNVNNRRRRSKSLDENRCKVSRIPKPNRGVIPVNKTITPSKVNKRTKMPNFAAMHERQFAKMESLLDHVERKAERAKVLTNSVQKPIQGSTAKKLQSSTSVEDRARSKAVKKIDMTADRTMVMDHPSDKVNSSRLPLKTTAPAPNVAPKPAFNLTTSTVKTFNVAPKPAFNLSTSTVKTFNATFSSRTGDSHDNKLAERRQRHIDMFKGRTTKDQKEKAEFIRGVRLNRRFELQMQHRRHLEED
ncbi:titin homolog [Drosophila teissieri]|uniref:titin homolog n=1 Tax=Drosophila teissieri TaxID=7243 RepID=UPI001CBA40E8|nr:titin homolog [Drosophila teissieri]